MQKSQSLIHRVSHGVSQLTSSVLSTIYPATCEMCGSTLADGEHLLCLECDANLSRSNIHLKADNRISQRLARLIPSCPVAAWFIYETGEPQHELIHQIKYHDRPKLGVALGKRFAAEIQRDGFFDGIDLILYIPMHRLKLLKRGYNQSLMIARGVSRQTGIDIGHNLISPHTHKSQTEHTRVERSTNVNDTIAVHLPEQLAGRHILIVDDVITTGSTMEAAVRAILPAGPASIALLSLGITRLH